MMTNTEDEDVDEDAHLACSEERGRGLYFSVGDKKRDKKRDAGPGL